jgi:drug/metabolite transporter (DMT)-like permease
VSSRGFVLFSSMCVIWGIPYLLIRVAVRDLSPATLVLARTGIAALLLLPVALARDEVRPVLRRYKPVLVFAAIEIAIPWVLLASGERRVTSSLAALLIAAVPLVGVVIARTTGARERFGPANVFGLGLGLLGVAAIVGLDVGRASGVGIAEVVVVAVCYAVGPAILIRALAGLPMLGLIAVSLAATALAYVPIAAFTLPTRTPRASVLASVATLAVVCTAVAFLLFFALIAEIGPVRATVITYVNPAVAAVLGVGILGERFTAGMGIGFALVLAGSVLATSAASGLRPSIGPDGTGLSGSAPPSQAA